MASGSDPYAVLGVARDATDAQIAHARHQLVRKYHPDVNHDPDAATRFADVQQAFHLLSDPVTRADYDRTHDEHGQAVVMRSADGGYGLDAEAAAGVLIQPTSVDFGTLTPQRPWADAKVTVAWTGLMWPGNITRSVGNNWWHVMDSAQPASSCVVFHLRAAAHSRGPKGQQHDQFTVTVNDTVLTVKLSAEFQGDFSAVAKPNFDLPAPFQVPVRLAMILFWSVVGLIILFAWVLGIISHMHH